MFVKIGNELNERESKAKEGYRGSCEGMRAMRGVARMVRRSRGLEERWRLRLREVERRSRVDEHWSLRAGL